VLAGIFSWRLYMLLFRVFLQPDLANARLCAVDDREAKGMYLRISVVMLVIVLMRILGQILIAIRTPADAIAAFQVLGGLIYLATFLWLAYRSRVAARQWFGGLGELAPVIGGLGRRWIPIAPLFFIALGVTLIYGAVSGAVHVGSAMVLTLNLVIGVLIFETLMQAFVRRLDSQLAGLTPASSAPKLPDVVARCIRVAVLIAVAVMVAESWVVNVLGLVNVSEWEQLTSSSRTAGATLFVAFVAWELFKYMTEPYMGPKSKDAAQAIADGDAAAGPASRISTMMPLMRRTAAVLIILIAVMVALQDFGVNITPLIAGASVFGIAISFGSQTLVKDIVSGLFYLSDDAFRVGEYIDCGKAKGTVEGFTLRSIKLRHQNGQVHTIPFGQLGQITNFSRDWITTKFNLRFARDTDIEKLRKASKKIGADMMEMPAIADQILAPFKMQGVADIAGNAIVVRFKFTAKPGNPAAIQREALKRMFSTFPALGFEFAKEGANVVVHTGAASNDPGGEGLPPVPVPANVPAAAAAG
jgi:small-conductance mechanosensitive channel